MWLKPSIPRTMGGRPGCDNSFHRAMKTGHEASGLAWPRATSSFRVAFAGSGRGRSGFVESFVAARKAPLESWICWRRLAV
jgi:hypothetical protein